MRGAPGNRSPYRDTGFEPAACCTSSHGTYSIVKRHAADVGGHTDNAGMSSRVPPRRVQVEPGSGQVPRGRGAADAPPGRFEARWVDVDDEGREAAAAQGDDGSCVVTTLVEDATRSAISWNESPDIPFRASLNPYRGCEHGCSYCYARPYHEFLGWSAGLDFETKLAVKSNLARLLREELASPRYEPEPIVFSGVTDAWQPVERRLGITRACLEVLLEAGNPVGAITKNRLITRDADLFAALASMTRDEPATTGARVAVSVTTLDATLARALEPRASSPAGRLDAIATLAAAGVPTHVMVAPVIPGLTDHELPSILEAARRAGAQTASYVFLRLPHGVADLFEAWLERHVPDRKAKVMSRVRDARGGERNDARHHVRFRGEGPFAEGVAALFRTTVRRLGFAEQAVPFSTVAWRRPGRQGQGTLFPS